MPDNYIFKDGAFWPVDANGNPIQTREVPAGADTVQTVITSIPTGDSIPDPASKYTYYMAHPGYKTENLDKFKRVSMDAKQAQQRAVEYILSHPEIYGELTEQDLQNEDVIQALYDKQYKTKAAAHKLNLAFYPQMRYTKPGHIEWKQSYIDDWTEGRTVCGDGVCRSTAIPIQVPQWVKKEVVGTSTQPTTTHSGYSSYLPVMQNDTTYLWKVSPEFITESKTTQNSTPSSKPKESPSSRSTTVTQKTSASPSTRRAASNQGSASTPVKTTTTWMINPFTGERFQMKFGGKMNYFSYFN